MIALVDRLELPVGRGQVNGSLDLSMADPALPLSADLLLRDMELGELLRKLGLPHAWVLLRASGRVQAKATIVPFRLTGETSLDLADFAVLDRSYEKRAQARKMLEFAHGKLEGAIEADPEKIVAREVAIEVGDSRMQVESTFFTDPRRGLDLAARSEIVKLDDLRGHFGPLPAWGTVKLAARVSGPYQAISIEGSASAQDVRFMDLSLGDVSAQVGFDTRSMKLSFAEIRGRLDDSDEEVARLHLNHLGVKLTKLTPEQASYIGVPAEGPYKGESYRY